MDKLTERRNYDLEERLSAFAVRGMEVVEALPKSRAGNHVAGQLLRCGTCPAPNYAEAKSAESTADFIHKLRVVLKELRETRVWLLLIQRKPLIKSPQRLDPFVNEAIQLISIFVTSIKTAQRNKSK